jgi:hypothetical protein
MRSPVARLILPFMASCLALACRDHEPPSTPRAAQVAKPNLRLVAISDLSGYLEPCGCQSRPLGGIDKAAATLKALKADKVPVLFVSAGDLLFGERPEGARDDQQAATQETWKAESLVGILNQVGLVAATPGPRDLRYGAEALQRVRALAKFSWLPSAPGGSNGTSAQAGTWLGEVGGTEVGIVGVRAFAAADSEFSPEQLKTATAQAQAEIDRLRAQGAQLVIGLFSSELRTGRRLSANLHGLDFALQGGVDSADAPAPNRSGDAVLLRAAHQGQGLLVVDLYVGGRGVFADVSEWTRRERRGALETRIADLATRVSTWERDPNVDKANLNQQRDKLAQLRTELAAQAAPAQPSGNAFSARFEQLGPEVQRDAAIRSLMDAYDVRVNDYNRKAFADVFAPPAPPGAARYVGSAACQSCHEQAFAWWTKHPHGHAYATLEAVHKQFNLSCAACHLTGYLEPGGSALVHNEGLTQVGCESCHGPGSQHVAQPAKLSARLVRAPGEATCKRCHTPEHSDLFEFTTYVARLRVPGHGLASGATPAP